MLVKKLTLTSEEFSRLYREILQKVAQEHQLVLDDRTTIGTSPGVKSSAFFGYGKDYSPDQYSGSLAVIIAKHPAVAAYVKKLKLPDEDKINFGWYLYKKRNELKDGERIQLTGLAYTKAYFLFLGYDGVDDFRRSEHNTNLIQGQSSSRIYQPLGGWTHYIGVYYSFISYRVKKFYITIQYNQTKSDARYKARMWGFHLSENRNIPSEKPLQSHELTGEAFIKTKHLYMYLAGDPNDTISRNLHFNVIGMCDARGGHDIENQQIINCSVQTVSLNGYIVNLEALLIKTTEAHAEAFRTNGLEFTSPQITPDLLPDESKTLHLYLMLQRRNFWIRDQLLYNFYDLRIKSIPVRNFTKRLEGTWRIWNFGLTRGKVIQSRLEIGRQQGGIEQPYAAYFYPFVQESILQSRPSLEEQVVALSVIRDEQGERLCFTTYLKGEHLSLSNYAMFDLLKLLDSGFTDGMFITAGYNRKGIVGGYAVLTKETQGRPVEPLELEREAALRYAESLGLLKMHDGLRDVWRRKLWRRRLWPNQATTNNFDAQI
jgi:hypothetical protein